MESNHSIFDLCNYDYELPANNIALFPANPRDTSRLLVYSQEQKIIHDYFYNISHHLLSNSILVLNDSKTLNARFLFQDKLQNIEVFYIASEQNNFLQQKNIARFNAFVGNAKKWKSEKIFTEQQIGTTLIKLCARIVTFNTIQNYFTIEFSWNGDFSMEEIFVHFGHIPLPPYIKRKSNEQDFISYQNIFSSRYGSVATPTAGLHFTENVFNQLKEKNIHTQHLTLHVNVDTFKPIKAQNILQHKMHGEYFYVSCECLKQLYNIYPNIFAVGTTSLRTLESIYLIGIQLLNNISTDHENHFIISQFEYLKYDLTANDFKKSLEAVVAFMHQKNLSDITCTTHLMITHNYKVKTSKALITNFHQPKSTLLAIVQSLVGENWKKIYHTALAEKYRFLSYGDSSLIWCTAKK